MPPKISKTQRWLDLISYLVGRRFPVEVGELMARLPAYAAMKPETARRIFERDKAALLALGIPIAGDEFRGSRSGAEFDGYYLKTHDFFLPYLRIVREARAPKVEEGLLRPGFVTLAPEHLTDAVEALRRVAELPGNPFSDAARTAYAKVVLDLDVTNVREAPVHLVEPPGAAASRATLHALSDALIDRRPVRMRYRGIARRAVTEREVDPYGLLAAGGRWYVIGYDHGAGDIREFRVDRIESLDVQEDGRSGTAPFFEVPEHFSIAHYAHRQAWELGSEAETEVLVRFAFPWSLWAARNAHGEPVRDEADGAAVRRFRVRGRDPFLRWLLSTEAEVEVLEPAAVVGELRALAAAVAALHENGG
jgi:predicted DNA-binding transcriptional regulator YafY